MTDRIPMLWWDTFSPFKDNSFVRWLYMLTVQLIVSTEAGQEVERGTGCWDPAFCFSLI